MTMAEYFWEDKSAVAAAVAVAILFAGLDAAAAVGYTIAAENELVVEEASLLMPRELQLTAVE